MKKSFIEELRDAQEKLDNNHSNYSSHFVVGVDLDGNGLPNSSLMISHSKPFEALGMIELLMKNLKNTKQEILNKLSTKNVRKNRQESFDVLNDESMSVLNDLPEDLRNKILSIKDRIRDAIENDDTEALQRIKDEVLDLKNESESGDDDDDDDFNINDFKGGLA